MKKTILWLTALLLLSSLLVAYSTDPGDYYFDGTYNLTDGILNDVALDDSTPSNGDLLSAHGWTVSQGTPKYNDSWSSTGSLSMHFSSETGNAIAYRDMPDNNTFNGTIGFMINESGASGGFYISVYGVGKTVRFGMKSSAETTYQTYDGVGWTDSGITLTQNASFWYINMTDGTNAVWYINNTLIASEPLQGLIRIDLVAEDTASYSTFIDEFFVANGDIPGADTPILDPFTVAPSITHPKDNSINDSDINIQVAHTTTNNDVLYSLYWGTSPTLTEADLVESDATRNASEYMNYTTQTGGAEGTYYFKAKVKNSTSGLVSANTSLYTFTISTFSVDNCSTGTGTPTLNFTLLNQSDDSSVFGDLEFLLTYNRSSIYKNYSLAKTNESNATFCIFPTNANISTDIFATYKLGNIVYTYYANDLTISNDTQVIPLYATTGVTDVTIEVVDLYDRPITGAIVKILLHDIGTNTFDLVEVINTNSAGEGTAHLVLNNEWYKFIVEYNGKVVKVTDPSERITTTTKKLKIDLGAGNWFDNYESGINIPFTLNFTNSTLRYNFIWSDPQGRSFSGCLDVLKRNASGDDYICKEVCTTGSAGEALCAINNGSVNGKRYIGVGYFKIDNTEYVVDSLEVSFLGGTMKKIRELDKEGAKIFGVFLAFILTLGIAFIGIWHPIPAVVLTIVGVVVSFMLGFLSLQLAAVSAMVAIGIILLYRLGRNR